MLLVDTVQTLTLDVGSASVGAVTVDITRGNGTVLVAGAATTDNNDGTYDYTLAVADNDQLDLLKLDWTVTSTSEVLTTYEEIVGDLLFTIDQARSKTTTGQQKPLASSSAYTDADIAAVRQEITEWFEDVTARSWVRRYCRGEGVGTGHRLLNLATLRLRTADGQPLRRPRATSGVARLISVTVDGTTVPTADIEIDGYMLYHKSGLWTRGAATDPYNVAIEWEYGLSPTPLEARDNGLRLAIKQLVPTEIPAYSQTFTEGGTSISYPGGGYVLPPQVHQWIKRHSPVLVG